MLKLNKFEAAWFIYTKNNNIKIYNSIKKIII